MISYWLRSSKVDDRILIPKYYDPELQKEIAAISGSTGIVPIRELLESGELEWSSGNEIGSEAYGTGSIPFVRTSDISNWEIKSSPKQGVSDHVYAAYAPGQDVRDGDILLVRDGTYLIGTNCFVTQFDAKILFQSHILKFRLTPHARMLPEELFLALNSPVVQRQLRARQFTADIIDTLGRRWQDIALPAPIGGRVAIRAEVRKQLDTRLRGRAFIKQAGVLLEDVLSSGSGEPLEHFDNLDLDTVSTVLTQDTVSNEYGGFEAIWIDSSRVRGAIYLPKYYDPEIDQELSQLQATCNLKSVQSLIDDGDLVVNTGDEPGKMAYGTGDVPFIRTSDFANWELKHDPKQNVSEQIYAIYREKQDVRPYDILLVRDGTYLVGSSTILLPGDTQCVYCGGLYKLRASGELDPFLLFGLLNSYIAKRQMRAKQFTRDVIDTLGKRLFEVILPVPKRKAVRDQIAHSVRRVVQDRVRARSEIQLLARTYHVQRGRSV